MPAERVSDSCEKWSARLDAQRERAWIPGTVIRGAEMSQKRFGTKEGRVIGISPSAKTCPSHGTYPENTMPEHSPLLEQRQKDTHLERLAAWDVDVKQVHLAVLGNNLACDVSTFPDSVASPSGLYAVKVL